MLKGVAGWLGALESIFADCSPITFTTEAPFGSAQGTLRHGEIRKRGGHGAELSGFGGAELEVPILRQKPAKGWGNVRKGWERDSVR